MFPPMVRETGLRFAPLERGGIFWSREFYKHLASAGAGELLGCGLSRAVKSAKSADSLGSQHYDTHFCGRRAEPTEILKHLVRALTGAMPGAMPDAIKENQQREV